MAEQQTNFASSAASRLVSAVRPVLVPLKARLLPLDNRPLLFAYAILLVSLLSFMLSPRTLPAWRYGGTILLLLALLTLNVAPLTDLPFAARGAWRAWAYLLVAGALFLLALGLSGGPYESFIPYIMFLLAGQSVWLLPLRYALLYTAALLVAFCAIASRIVGLDDTLGRLPDVSFVLLFTVLFSWLTTRYGEQTARAEALLGQLRAANAELTLARERARELAVAEERVQLAREIHDGLGHHLTVLNVQIQTVAKLLHRDLDRAEAEVARCHEEVQAALRDVRASVGALRQTPLDGSSLHEALGTLVRDFDRHATLDARFEQHGDAVSLSPDAALALYRAAQEGLTNAHKHAVARHVSVSLDYSPTGVRLLVQDDGTGGVPALNGGFGLQGLRERAARLGGTCVAGPSPDGGFRLELSLPYQGEQR